jgi:AmiR/NasT family two-component response regulator
MRQMPPISSHAAQHHGRSVHAPEDGHLGVGGRRTGGSFAHLSVAVVADRDQTIEPLIRSLQKRRADVRHVWPPPEQYPTTHDVIFGALVPDLPMRLPWLPGAAECALIVVLPSAAPVDLRLLRNCAAHAVLNVPAPDPAVDVALAMAVDLFGYEQRLSTRIAKLDENLRTMRTVERAKTILMTGRGLSEEAAYEYLRTQAMVKRVSIGRLSVALVDSEELLS